MVVVFYAVEAQNESPMGTVRTRIGQFLSRDVFAFSTSKNCTHLQYPHTRRSATSLSPLLLFIQCVGLQLRRAYAVVVEGA
jgi:hypothetical protein